MKEGMQEARLVERGTWEDWVRGSIGPGPKGCRVIPPPNNLTGSKMRNGQNKRHTRDSAKIRTSQPHRPINCTHMKAFETEIHNNPLC